MEFIYIQVSLLIFLCTHEMKLIFLMNLNFHFADTLEWNIKKMVRHTVIKTYIINFIARKKTEQNATRMTKQIKIVRIGKSCKACG